MALGRPVLSKPRQIQIEGVDKKNVQQFQQGMRRFQAEREKAAQQAQANKIKEAQIYIQSAKTALNNKKLQLEMDQFDREVLSANQDMDRYKFAQQSWNEQISNNPNMTRADIQAQLQQWLPLTNSKVVGTDAGKRITMLQKMDEQILGSEMIKSRNEYMDARNNGMAWDSPEELKDAVDWDNSIANNKIKKVEVGKLPDGTPDYKYINTGILTDDFLDYQEFKLEEAQSLDTLEAITELGRDDDFRKARRSNKSLSDRWDSIKKSIIERDRVLADRKHKEKSKDGKGVDVTEKIELDGRTLTIKHQGLSDSEVDDLKGATMESNSLKDDEEFNEFLLYLPEYQEAFDDYNDAMVDYLEADPDDRTDEMLEVRDANKILNIKMSDYNKVIGKDLKPVDLKPVFMTKNERNLKSKNAIARRDTEAIKQASKSAIGDIKSEAQTFAQATGKGKKDSDIDSGGVESKGTQIRFDLDMEKAKKRSGRTELGKDIREGVHTGFKATESKADELSARLDFISDLKSGSFKLTTGNKADRIRKEAGMAKDDIADLAEDVAFKIATRPEGDEEREESKKMFVDLVNKYKLSSLLPKKLLNVLEVKSNDDGTLSE